MIYVYGFCGGNLVHAVAEYQRRFPNPEYQPEECLLEFTSHCEIPVHFPAFAFQPSVMLMKASIKKKTLFRWYRAVHVRGREELQDVFVFPHESVENTARRWHVSIPRAASATSWTWRFCSEVGILQVDQWQSLVASLHSVY